MGTMFDEIGDDVAALIREQQMFFVGTANAFREHRNQLIRVAEQLGPEKIRTVQATANAVSIDGLRGLRLS